MPVDMDTCVREHTEAHAAARGGEHPLAECLPWAQALVSWVEALPRDETTSWVQRRRDWYAPRVGLDGLTLALAESLRLAMALWRVPVGDLAIANVERVLSNWLDWDIVPGTDAWPAPEGTPHVAHWASIFTGDAELAQEAARCAYAVFQQLEGPSGEIPMGEAWRFRMDTYNITYSRMADVAPLLGLPMPVQVAEPADYFNVPGLRVEQAA
ncbi:hypothetical protein [Streptomyces sp. NPDC051546]|uniref:hypothetical protein n=1 Tax=Streptomyces sp. NPDC051546 TaxID=3365655 RepID=UPI0037BAD61C